MRRIKPHIYFWTAYFCYSCITDYYTVDSGTFSFLEEFLVLITNPVLIFYLSVATLFLINLGSVKEIIRSSVLLSLSFGIYFLVKYELRMNFHLIMGKEFVPIQDFRMFVIFGVLWYVQFFLWALGYYYAIKYTSREKDLRIQKLLNAELGHEKYSLEMRNLELQNQNLELQAAKIKSDYNFLKAQINPHFLYNTLNFFYTRTETKDPETAEGIILLTEIMRYSLQQGEDGKVHINDEVKHLENYILLQQLRFGNKLCIEFDKSIPKGKDYRILPHIFITLVENAFKHGDIRDKDIPLHIKLYTKEEKLYFEVNNKIRKGATETPGTGVGLVNVLERLRMEYGEAVSLLYGELDGRFNISLSVPVYFVESPSVVPTPGLSVPQPQALTA